MGRCCVAAAESVTTPSPMVSGHANDFCGAEGVEAVDEGDAVLDFGGLAVGQSSSHGCPFLRIGMIAVACHSRLIPVQSRARQGTSRFSGAFCLRHSVVNAGTAQSRVAILSRLATIPVVCRAVAEG